MIKKLDWYIIKKFLGTYFYSIALIILIVIVFDVSEKIDDFLENGAPLSTIIFDYYLNFIPYFANLFSSLFIFIAVIFFTSKMASHSEIVAMLSSGISFSRFARPYIVSATLLASLSFVLINWVIPGANGKRLAFEEKYVRNAYVNKEHNIHRQIGPGLIMYFSSYNASFDIGYRFSLEKFKNGQLKSKLISDYAKWDTTLHKWKVVNYYIRNIDSTGETILKGDKLDTTLNMNPEEFRQRVKIVESMNMRELNKFIDKEKMRGASNIIAYELAKYNRLAFPFSTFILSIIGMSLSSRKSRGGVGLNIGAGIALTFIFILFQQISSVLATNVGFNPILAVWLPNIVFAVIALILFRRASK